MAQLLQFQGPTKMTRLAISHGKQWGGVEFLPPTASTSVLSAPTLLNLLSRHGMGG
jgi:hypothetical protein